MAKYFQEHNKIFVAPEGAKEIHDHLPPAQYTLRKDAMQGFYLEKSVEFELPKKVFGDSELKAKRVLKTYNAVSSNLGVLLTGEKGSGKTMFSKLLSKFALEQGIATVIINENFDNDPSMGKYLTDITDRCVVFFDEFEKIFKSDDQEQILTLLDGTYQSNKLFLLTANNVYNISDYIMNRPGRAHYHFRYGSLEESFIREYCEYQLSEKSYTDVVVRLAGAVGKFNFDMLQSVVRECNIHNESPEVFHHFMNIDMNKDLKEYSYKITRKDNNMSFVGETSISLESSFIVTWESGLPRNDEGYLPVEYAEFKPFNYVKFDHIKGSVMFENSGYFLELKPEKERHVIMSF